MAAAREVASDDDEFATGEAAANALLEISAHLRYDAEACAAERDDRDGECRALFAGAGHMQAASVGLLRCARPEVFDARQAIAAFLDALGDEPATAALPRIPYCT